MTPGRARLRLLVHACTCACVGALAFSAAPAGAADRQGLNVDLGVVGVAVGPTGANVDVAAGPVNAHVGADSSGTSAQLNAGPVQAQVNVPAPAPVTPPQIDPPSVPPVSVPDPGGAAGGAAGTVNDVAGNVPATGSGGSDPAASSAGGGGPAGSGGGSTGATAPTGRGSRATAPTGSGGGNARGRGGRGRDSGGPGGGATGTAGDAGSGSGAAPGSGVGSGPGPGSSADNPGGVTRTLERVVQVIPLPIWIALGALALLTFVFFGRGQVVARRARRLTQQREELLQDVGLLQQALLPEIPERLGELATTVAYRPADGPAAGGDFYDAFLLDGERVAIIVGDVSGHGRAALARTALMRYTLRAYLDAGLEPRRALKVAGRALDDDLGGDFATVVVAVHDPAHATLTYSSAGHPPPIVTGSGAFEPVTALSSPPIGAGLPTGQRQTTLHLPADAVACFFTDGLVEAKLGGGLLGPDRLAGLLEGLGPDVTAAQLIDAVAAEADSTSDDMAACVLKPDATGAADHVPDRVEEVELNAPDLAGDRIERYLTACGVSPEEAGAAIKSAEASVGDFGGALLRVRVDKGGVCCEVESAAGLHDPLGAPPTLGDAPGGAAQPATAATSDSA